MAVLISSIDLNLITPASCATKLILYRTADAPLRGELLANSAVLIERPSNLLCRTSNCSVLYDIEFQQAVLVSSAAEKKSYIPVN